MNMKNQNEITAVAKMSQFKPRILIVDDDPIVTAVIQQHLRKHYVEAEVCFTNEPVIRPGFDIYFLDNDFGGAAMANRLLRQIRELSPQALVVALSNTLDLPVLQDLMNGGCNVVYDKRYPAESKEAREVINNYLKILEDRYNSSSRASLVNLVGSLKQLLGAWNSRLAKESTL
jgi:DNA-binding NarL/FixJ family response regulator